jgi:hypothetical protein
MYDVSAMPITGGPYLTHAFFCEKLLREPDGVTSAIRIVDRWVINGPTPTMSPTIIQATLVISLHSGIYRGQANITITPISPSNVRMQSFILPVLFEGEDDRGAGIVIPIGFPVQEDGAYWFEVSLSKQNLPAEIITCIPMRIAYLQQMGSMQLQLPPNQPDQS